MKRDKYAPFSIYCMNFNLKGVDICLYELSTFSSTTKESDVIVCWYNLRRC